uniref:AGC (cAMP-dependent, cGMP-dependent and protein kinase C) kinase family protein n=1 Tax=Tanacetum cinerariifolium TaxID=118510 RepID=A0A6L2J315_TANCI|nr:AGC (cAMP-dependent, cGMP-dependent and protein kinase C) kinase family protein [Tanacetum cinerariifolium]
MLSIYRAFPSGPPKANREVSAYNYKHFDAIKALRDNPDLMWSASGDALYGYLTVCVMVSSKDLLDLVEY